MLSPSWRLGPLSITCGFISPFHVSIHLCVHQSLSRVWFFVTLWTVACQAPLSKGFLRQEHWNGLPFFSSRASSQPRDWTHFHCVSCIAAYLRLLIFLPAILISACAPSSPAFCMMNSAYFSTDLQLHIGHLPIWGVHLSVSYLFSFSYCSWGSQDKNTEVVCHSLLQNRMKGWSNVSFHISQTSS